MVHRVHSVGRSKVTPNSRQVLLLEERQEREHSTQSAGSDNHEHTIHRAIRPGEPDVLRCWQLLLVYERQTCEDLLFGFLHILNFGLPTVCMVYRFIDDGASRVLHHT